MDLVGGNYRRTAKKTPLKSKKMCPKNEKSDGFAGVIWTPKMTKKRRIYYCKSQILKAYPIFLGVGGG